MHSPRQILVFNPPHEPYDRNKDAGMQLSLPDIGDLLVLIALLFTALIVLFETLERRREGRREQRILDAIEREYHLFTRLGRL